MAVGPGWIANDCILCSPNVTPTLSYSLFKKVMLKKKKKEMMMMMMKVVAVAAGGGALH